MKTVTIEIPDDSELIKEGDNYRIRQIEVPRTWEEFCKRNNISTEYYIDTFSQIQKISADPKGRNIEHSRNLCASREDAESILAITQLIRLRKAWVREWVPKESDLVYYICSGLNGIIKIGYIAVYTNHHTLTFPSETMAHQFVECFGDLLNKAKTLIA